MSRAYQIRISESVTHHIHVDDGIQANLGLLGILGRERSASLLADALADRGWTIKDGVGTKSLTDEIEVEVDLASGTITVRAHHEDKVDLSAERQGTSYTPEGGADKERLQAAAKAELDAKARNLDEAAKAKLTEALDQALAGLRPELDEVTSAVTRAALIERAGQMGQIMEVAENAAGEMSIRVKL